MSGSRIPILYVHHRPQLGGAPASLAQLLRELDPRFEAHVFCPAGEAAALFAVAGARVHEGPVAGFGHTWDNPYAGLRWLVLGRELVALAPHLRALDRVLRRYRFPLVHLNDSPLLPAAWIAKRRGARVVWHLRSALAHGARDARGRAVVRTITRLGDAAIAIDRDIAASFPLGLPITVVHNPVRRPDTAPAEAAQRARLRLPADRVLIGFAGYIRRQKGWPELVDAAQILVRQDRPVHFVVIGGGVRPPSYFRSARGRALQRLGLLADEETAMRHAVAAKQLDAHFSFLPFSADTAAIYDALDVVTFPNQGAGLGRPVLEAAMHGKPAVASGSRDGGGVLLPEQTGILLTEPTAAQLAAALARLTDDAALRDRLGRAAAEHARRCFDPAAAARAVEAVYDRVLGLESGRPGRR